MAIAFTCQACGKAYRVSNHLAGTVVTCTKCESPMSVPAVIENEEVPSIPSRSAKEHGKTALGSQAYHPHPNPLPKEEGGIQPDDRVYVMPQRAVNRPLLPYRRAGDDPRLLLTDESARRFSALLLIALLGGVIYLSYRMTAVEWMPDEMQGRLRGYLVMFVGWQLLAFFCLLTPMMWLACALACNWTKWELPESAYLRAAGTCTLPNLLMLAILVMALQRNLWSIGVLLLFSPFILILTLKELMGLKWTTTLVAAGLLLLLFRLARVGQFALEWFLVPRMQEIAKVDAKSFEQWAKEHPEEFRETQRKRAEYVAVQQQRGWQIPFTTPSAPMPSSMSPQVARGEPLLKADPYVGRIEPLIEDLRAAVAQAPQQTREQLAAKQKELAERMKEFRAAAYSPLWAQANRQVVDLAREVAQAPSESPPGDLFEPIDARPLAIPKVSENEQADEVFAFKSLRLRPLKESKIDLESFAQHDKLQRWSLTDHVAVAISLLPVADAKQQRPWVADRHIIAHLATQKNLTPFVVPNLMETSHGRVNDIGWTRIAARRGQSSLVEHVTYVGRLKDQWVVAAMTETYGNAVAVAALDKFVQGITIAPAKDSVFSEAAVDPYDPKRVVERFSEPFADPTPVLAAQGAAGVDALRAYVRRMGDSAPVRARHLLQSLVREKPEIAAAGAVDVRAALATIRGSKSSFDKRDAMKQLAGATVDEHHDEVAAELEQILLGDDATFYGEDAAAALVKWWRPQTVAALLPLLEENVWPPGKREAAMKVLRVTRDDRAVFPIVRWIIKEPEEVVAALTDMGPVAEDEVMALLRDRSAAVRANAARILREIGTQKSLIELRRAANDTRDPIAAGVARAAVEMVLARVKQAKATTATTAATAPATTVKAAAQRSDGAR